MLQWAVRHRQGEIVGTAVVDGKTKQLLKRIRPGQIAVIHHRDLDEVAAIGLIEKRVRAVINGAESISGMYPTPGPGRLLAAHIPVLDNAGNVLEELKEGMPLWIEGDCFGSWNARGEKITLGRGRRLTDDLLKEKLEQAKSNMTYTLERFIENTLHYAEKEKQFVIRSFPSPPLRTEIRGRHVIIVVRGASYKEDLFALRFYIEEVKPVLIAVDGGADALLENGYRPDIIVGDMDSVSDRALLCGAEVVVHAYPDGRAPGLERVKALKINPHILPSVGTSEDVAMLLAYEKGAELIVALGTHTNMVDFLEKGRKGMASTLLVRMKIGTKLVDAKGVNQLYRSRMRWRELSLLGVASVFPVMALAVINPGARHLFRILWLHLKMLVT